MTSARRKRFVRRQALQRYQKHRRRNILAKPGCGAFVVVLDHLKAGYNVPKIFRSAEAFGAREVHLIGVGPFDPAPAKGAFKNVPARFFGEFVESYRALSETGYTLFSLTPAGGDPLADTALPLRSAFIFGHEEAGLSFLPGDYPDIRPLTIPQKGAVQSLNVSVAASVVMYEYIRQHP
jgi:tRNA G18 (ribose-2'-O)-methylase SpoU